MPVVAFTHKKPVVYLFSKNEAVEWRKPERLAIKLGFKKAFETERLTDKTEDYKEKTLQDSFEAINWIL